MKRLGTFGVPTIVLDDNAGPEMFGPVIASVPEARQQERCGIIFLWMTRQTEFYEIKRSRPPGKTLGLDQ